MTFKIKSMDNFITTDAILDLDYDNKEAEIVKLLSKAPDIVLNQIIAMECSYFLSAAALTEKNERDKNAAMLSSIIAGGSSGLMAAVLFKVIFG